MPYKNKEDKKNWINNNGDKVKRHQHNYRDNHKLEIKQKYQEKNEVKNMATKQHREEDKLRKAKYKAQRKQFYFEQMGGKCCVCGLIEDVIAYDYHHVDSDSKEYAISSLLNKQSISNITFKEQLENELAKCILVCVICHRKIHAGKIECPTKIGTPTTTSG